MAKVRTTEKIKADVTANFLIGMDEVVGKTKKYKIWGDACEALGLAKSTFTEIQKGNRQVPLEVAVKACETFGFNFTWMFGGLGEMYASNDLKKTAKAIEDRVAALEKFVGLKNK